MNYYNEWDKGAANWLRELIANKLIPYGYVDERSITEVTPRDLEGFTQCHFFAGIGGWSRALQLAGVPETTRLWTGSPPCQPFSRAGKQKGKFDERHLAPTFLKLVSACKPPMLFGEQVAKAIETGWLDDLHEELEREGYSVGAAVLSCDIVGAPHKRDRLFFGAINELANTYCNEYLSKIAGSNATENGSETCNGEEITSAGKFIRTSEDVLRFCDSGTEYLCRDGKKRIVEPTIPLLADGVSSTMGRLRGYGNAIVPQVGALFIESFVGAYIDACDGLSNKC